MKKQTLNNVLLIGSAIVSLGIISFAVYKLSTKNDEESDTPDLPENGSQPTPPPINDPLAPSTTPSKEPEFDRNNQLINPINAIKGKMLFPKSGSANIRKENFVNDGMVNNLIVKIDGSNTPIGLIMADSKGQEDPPMRWFKVLLKKPVSYGVWPFNTTIKEGWVRADVVTFK